MGDLVTYMRDPEICKSSHEMHIRLLIHFLPQLRILTSIVALSDCPDFQSCEFHYIPAKGISVLCILQGFLSWQTLYHEVNKCMCQHFGQIYNTILKINTHEVQTNV